MTYALLQVGLHGIELESLEEVMKAVEEALRPICGGLESDFDIEPIESAGLKYDD